jgi:uracil-DNA glycosylase
MGEKNTIQSLASEFLGTIQDFSQYISHQNSLGNTDFKVSDTSKITMAQWGRPKKKAPFLFQGSEKSKIFFIDSEGSFFSGEQGGLLVKILTAMKLTKESVFICNAQNPSAINARIKKIKPEVIITLGQTAGQLILNLNCPIEEFQGKFHSHEGIKVMPTFHPKALLERPGLKRKVWEDMQKVMEEAGLNDYK